MMKQNYLKSLFLMLMMCVCMGAWAQDATLTFSAQGYENAQQVSSGTIDSYTSWSATDGTNSTAYYNTGSGLRVYNGGKFTVTSTKTIASITLTFSGTGFTFSTSNTTTPQTVKPNATSYSWDVGRTCRLQKVEVTYKSDGESSEPATTYTVTVSNNIANGTVTTNPTSAAEGATVALTATPADGYEFGEWNVTDASSNNITVTDNKFTMPAANVTVSATFNKIQSGETVEGTTVTWTASEQGYTNSTQYKSATVDENISLAFGDGTNDGKYYDIGSGIRIYTNGKITVSAANGGTISKIVITYSAEGYAGTFSANTGKYSLSETTGTWTGSTGSVVLTNTASSGHARIQKIEVTYTEGEDPTPSDKTLTSIAVSGTPEALWTGDDFTHNGVTVTATYSDNTTADVTSSCEFSGFNMSTSGLQTVTVTYEGQSTTYNVEVKTIANTQETAYTVAEAIALIDAGNGLNTEVYVKGTISEIVTAWSEQYGNVSFNISEDGTTEGTQFQFYRNFKGAEKTKWTAEDEKPMVGASVVGYGKLSKHNTTYEFAEGNYLVEITLPQADMYTITIASMENGSVTADNVSAVEGATVTLTATPDEGYEFGEWSVTAGAEVVEVVDNKFTMPAANVTVSATFTEKPAADGETITFDNLGYESWGKSASFSGSTYDELSQTNSNVVFEYIRGTGSTYANTTAIRFYKDNKLTFTAPEGYDITSIEWTGSSFKDDVTTDNETCTSTTSALSWVGKASSVTFTRPSNATSYITLSAVNVTIKKSEGNVTPDPDPTTNGTITFAATDGTDYYATFSSDRVVAFEDVMVGDGDESMASMKAYGVFVIDGSLVLTDLYDTHNDGTYTYVPKNTGVLLKYHIEEGTMPLAVPFKYADEWDGYLDDISSNNMLVPCTETNIFKAEADGNMYYKLAYGDNTNKTKLGFWWGAENGSGNFKVKAGGAVLCVPQTSGVKGFSFDMAKDEDAIKGVEQKTFDTVIYDMQGRKVSKTQKGLYIINGRKMVK